MPDPDCRHTSPAGNDGPAVPRVAVIYTHFPHYREPVFRALARAEDLDCRFFYDPSGIAETIRSGATAQRHAALPVRRIGPLMLQPGTLRLALRGEFDAFILLGNPFILTSWLAAAILRLRRRPVLFWTHGWLRPETGAKGRLRRAYYRLADALLVYGERARGLGTAAGYPAGRIHVIYNSLDYDRQKALRLALGPARPPEDPGRPVRFLTVARLVEGLDLHIALDAIRRLRDQSDPPVSLTIVGDGPLRGALERQAAREDLPVQFTGAIYDEARLAELFLDSAAVVSPGKVGLLAMHALAYGIPVITHDDADHQMPEVEAIEDGRTGAFFRRGDAADLAARMHALSRRGIDADARAAAITRIETDYTPTRQADRITAAVHALLTRPEAHA
ncbi:glycosyltransferase [Marinibacterium profundimaris]|uniref:glycosyltransferase n=1 Tax=Marinibacterium profundimaris TaxID=1679460 RepID=UPI000B522885|nr:glycosyltransferase [Marinibacterium profundimaris]